MPLTADHGWLIRGAELAGGRIADVRVQDGRITALGEHIETSADARVIEADGAFLCPGLHDHHIHLMAFAAALDSLPCGPPRVRDANALKAALRNMPGTHWVRGVGYHDSVAGPIDRTWLDCVCPDRPVRIQHRSGRLWIVNSAGLARLGIDHADGRLFDADALLRNRLGETTPDLARASAVLAGFGVTGLTDATPRNGPAEQRLFAAAAQAGVLRQNVLLMGAADAEGPLKLHEHEHALPPLDEIAARIQRAHAQGRVVAAHCVTATELAFFLAALGLAGPRPGDRVEHCGVCPPAARAEIARLGLTVVTQPHFIAEKGDAYRTEVDIDDLPWLYPAASLIAAGIPLGAGSDAPFGGANPWASMQAAVTRRTPARFMLGPDERLSPEQALALYITPPDAPGGAPRRITVGAPADLCLIDRGWAEARTDLAAVQVRLTLRGGAATHGPTGSAIVSADGCVQSGGARHGPAR